MSDWIDKGAIKVIEIIGISSNSFEDAIQQAVAKTAESVKGITGVEVINMNVKVNDGKISQYRVACKLAFAVR